MPSTLHYGVGGNLSKIHRVLFGPMVKQDRLGNPILSENLCIKLGIFLQYSTLTRNLTQVCKDDYSNSNMSLVQIPKIKVDVFLEVGKKQSLT